MGEYANEIIDNGIMDDWGDRWGNSPVNIKRKSKMSLLKTEFNSAHDEARRLNDNYNLVINCDRINKSNDFGIFKTRDSFISGLKKTIFIDRVFVNIEETK